MPPIFLISNLRSNF
uniref:Uncharacterized protein n=1 Tax=Rhizophora mucronata TaxID=61149 RepID=A0A2P2J240_RHIMU